jgi:hypothetical protein
LPGGFVGQFKAWTNLMLFNPMVARLLKEPFDRKGSIFEIKWDEFRAIAEVDGVGGVKLYSRWHNSFNKRFPNPTRAGERPTPVNPANNGFAKGSNQGHKHCTHLFYPRINIHKFTSTRNLAQRTNFLANFLRLKSNVFPGSRTVISRSFLVVST